MSRLTNEYTMTFTAEFKKIKILEIRTILIVTVHNPNTSQNPRYADRSQQKMNNKTTEANTLRLDLSLLLCRLFFGIIRSQYLCWTLSCAAIRRECARVITYKWQYTRTIMKHGVISRKSITTPVYTLFALSLLLTSDFSHNKLGKREINVGIIHEIDIIVTTLERVITMQYLRGLVIARYLSPVITHRFPTET